MSDDLRGRIEAAILVIDQLRVCKLTDADIKFITDAVMVVTRSCRTDTTPVRQYADGDMLDWADWLLEEVGLPIGRLDLESCFKDWRESRPHQD